MTALKLRFPTPDEPELPLDIGVHGIGRRSDGGLAPATGDHPVLVRFCVDRRGVWLTVAEGVQGVHVNGRQVRRMAMLRTGDAIYVDGNELRLMSMHPVAVRIDPASANDTDGQAEERDPRIVLRGVGGRYHGRSFTLDRPMLVGRHVEADIRIDDPAFADRHARLERVGHAVQLTDLGSVDGSVVNGESTRDAVLLAGDQVVFDAHHRFVVEAPSRVSLTALPDFETAFEDTAPRVEPPQQGGGLRLPWLLLAAVVLAGLLSVLLLFGAG